MTAVVSTSNNLTMSSLRIAELTGKRHDHVLRDIRKMLTDIHGEGGLIRFEDTRINPQNNQAYPCFLLDEAHATLLIDKYNGLARVPLRLQEEAALKTIEQLLGVSLIRQFKVLNYRIDGYDPINNTAYEIDEPQHRYQSRRDNARQLEIETALRCKFVRIKL